jgi:membrane fusion protein, copper/silver efflux system
MNFPDQLRKHRTKLLPAAIVLTGFALGALFWADIAAWFSGQPLRFESQAEVTTAQAGPFQLKAALFPDTLREKGNLLRLQVQDRNGEAVDDAQVKVTYHMPRMGSMPEMRGEAEVVDKGDGRYDAAFDLTMDGSWTLKAEIRGGDRSGEASFTMTVGTSGLTTTGGAGSGPADSSSVSEILPTQFDEATLARLRASFEAYEHARALLAQDTVGGLSVQAEAIRGSLEAATRGLPGTSSAVAQHVGQAQQAAQELGQASDPEQARRHFAELSKYFVALASADPRLAEGWTLFECPMAKGFPKWFQRSDRLGNPYMGQKMLQCGTESEWTIPAPDGQTYVDAGGDDDIAHYTCSMHPSVRQEGPGTCPICSMDLMPVSREEVETGTIFVDQVRRQRLGVRTTSARRRQMTLRIRAVGEVQYDETRLSDVNLRMSGWVHGLVVDKTGQRVRHGQTLFMLYSPELYAAQLEHLTAVRRVSEGTAETFANLRRASRRRLALLGMSDAQIEELERRGEAWENVPILAPANGYVIQKSVVEGARVESGTLVYRIADLSRIWIDAEVYESDLRHVRAGQSVQVELPYLLDRTFEGQVDYVYPTLQGATRTGRVRVVLANPDLELKPNMYATVWFEVDLGKRLAIPDSAVIYTGPRRLVFIDLGEGRLRPRRVKLGVHAESYYEVTDGLRAGDLVVTSGNFLIAAESRIRSAAKYWEGGDDSE